MNEDSLVNSRLDKLGIKQTIQRHWMDKTVQMMLEGWSEKEIRSELDGYLSTQKQSGGYGERGRKTYGLAISLLASWFSPANELKSLRDDALALANQVKTEEWIPIHWAIISASYPFWFNVAMQTGRLFNLQDTITQAQVFNRMKEQYGDRETVVRNARYTLRSFVAWGAMSDTSSKGCYEMQQVYSVENIAISLLMLEGALHATRGEKAQLSVLQNSPAFFPFQLPLITGDFISKNSTRIEIFRYSYNDALLKLKVS